MVAMMNYLVLALLLCTLPSASASCYFKDLTPDMTQCQDDTDKTWHAVGSSWTNSKCLTCTCSECCTAYSTPTSYPDDCIAVFDQSACKYNVHKKDDPTVACPVLAGVGK